MFSKDKVKNLLKYMPAQWLCRLEYKRQYFSAFNERPVEFCFVFRQLERLYPRKILDVGTGTTALPHLMRNCGFLVTATDNIRDYWTSGMFNRHYHVINDDITESHIDDKFDLITCISVLEHIVKYNDAIRNMFSLLNTNGHLILTFPYSENSYIKNVYKLIGSDAYDKDIPYICQSYSRKEIAEWLQKNEGVIIEQEYWQFWDGDYWRVGNKVIPPRKVNSKEKHQLCCVLIQKVSN
jgi:2-polyprenyl-3-methyl-5-hydroxy-6-metoxy-1,4-benzoquinol methylase